MQIGEMLVRAKAISPSDLEDAIGWQVIYGGRLGTNLLELGLVEEKVLAEQLGKQHGCEFAFGNLEIPESMVQAIPAVVARRHEIVPWKIDGRRLKVLTISPEENLQMFDEIGFRLGKQVKPVVAPEFRIHQLLRRYFDSVRQMRALDFGVKPKSKRTQEAEKKAETAELEKAADLMNDEVFAAIYQQAMEGRSQSSPPAAPPEPPPPAPSAWIAPPAPAAPPTPARPMAPPVVPVAAPPLPVRPPPTPSAWAAPPVAPTPAQRTPSAGVPVAQPTPSVGVPVVQRTPPAGVPVPQHTPPAGVPVAQPSFDIETFEEDEPLLEAELLEDVEEQQPDEAISADQWAAAFQNLEHEIASSEPEAPPPRDASPLSFPEAVSQISKAGDRDAVAHTVLRYARSRNARAVLLSVQGDVALGWDAMGDELSTDMARRIAFPLGVPSAFNLVRTSRSHYVGPLGKEPGNVRFLKLAGKKWPASAVLLPVLFREKVVYILYADNGHKQHVNAEVGELLILSQNISRSMEQMVAKRQAARRAN